MPAYVIVLINRQLITIKCFTLWCLTLSQVRESVRAVTLTSRMSHICVQVKTCSAGGYTVWRFLSSETKVINYGKDI